MELLKLGSTGTLVQYLQSTLKTLGFYKGNIDGIFGNQTKNAVITFQREFGIPQDGIVGPNTWNKLSAFFYIVPTDISYGSNILSINSQGFATKFPFLEQGNIGYSVLKKELKYFKFGRGPKQIFYSGAIHGNEWINTTLLMKFLENLCTAYLNRGNIWGYPASSLFNQYTLYVVPLANPDGVDLVVGNIKKYHPQSYNSAQKLSQNYLTIQFTNGWKANIEGIDLNLQFPAEWETARNNKFAQGYTKPGPRDYVGPSPLYAQEAKALYNFTLSKNFSLILAYHSQGETIYWKFLNYLPPRSYEIGRHFSQVSGYLLENTPYTSGFAGYKDWFIQNYNLPGYTIETGLGENPLPISQFQDIYNKNIGILILGMLLI